MPSSKTVILGLAAVKTTSGSLAIPEASSSLSEYFLLMSSVLFSTEEAAKVLK